MLLRQLILTFSVATLANGQVTTRGTHRSVAADSAAIVEIEHEWIATRDSTTLDRILAGDFQHPVAAGVILSKTQHIAWAVAHPFGSGPRATFASLTVRVFGDAALATGFVCIPDSTGAEVGRNVFSDMFVRRANRWQAVSAQETAVPTSKR